MCTTFNARFKHWFYLTKIHSNNPKSYHQWMKMTLMSFVVEGIFSISYWVDFLQKWIGTRWICISSKDHPKNLKHFERREKLLESKKIFPYGDATVTRYIQGNLWLRGLSHTYINMPHLWMKPWGRPWALQISNIMTYLKIYLWPT